MKRAAASASGDSRRKRATLKNFQAGGVNSNGITKLHISLLHCTKSWSDRGLVDTIRIFLKLVLKACLKPRSILAIALARWSIPQTSSFVIHLSCEGFNPFQAMFPRVYNQVLQIMLYFQSIGKCP